MQKSEKTALMLNKKLLKNLKCYRQCARPLVSSHLAAKTKRLTNFVIPLTKDKYLLFGSIAFFVLTFLARLYFAGQSAAKNVEMKDLYISKQELQQEVSNLRYEDLKLSSMAVIQEKATKLGFIPMQNLLLSLDINVSQPLAVR